MAGICMFIAANKMVQFPQVPGYQPILVGKGAEAVSDEILTDRPGDSISEKNPYYCEMTGLYWVWKNLELPEYVGLCHYRRYFVFHDVGGEHSWENLERSISLDGVLPLLQKVDIILPKPLRLGCVEIQYQTNNRKEDLDVVKDIIRQEHPECVPAMDEVLGGHRLYTGNMMLVSRELFHEYMGWLFPILFRAEERISIPYEDAYQRRLFGFLAERLLNIYVVHRKLRILECPVALLPPLNECSGDYRRNPSTI